MDKIKNRIEAINSVNSWLNKNIPLINKRWSMGIKINADGSISKKDSLELNEFLHGLPNARMRAYIKHEGHGNISVNVDQNYSVGKDTVGYFRQNHYLNSYGDNGNPAYDIYDYEEYKEKAQEIDVLKDKIYALKSQLSHLQYVTGE